MRRETPARDVAGLQWAVTAFYVVAVGHGLARGRGWGRDATGRWAAGYLVGMAVAFRRGRRRGGDPVPRARVTALLAVEYGLLRLGAAILDAPLARLSDRSRHLVGAGVEALALAVAYALGYGTFGTAGFERERYRS